jgi:glucosamine--fructose-6-phosphate aminotransferase (isomerizing)
VHAGPEISVCSTKAFTAQVLATELLALRFARMRDMAAGDGRAWVLGLEALSAQMRLMLEHSAACEARIKKIKGVSAKDGIFRSGK